MHGHSPNTHTIIFDLFYRFSRVMSSENPKKELSFFLLLRTRLTVSESPDPIPIILIPDRNLGFFPARKLPYCVSSAQAPDRLASVKHHESSLPSLHLLFPSKPALWWEPFRDHISPLCSAEYALSGAILPRKSFPTFLSDISIIEKRAVKKVSFQRNGLDTGL